jgi:hypothetical protein
MNDSVAQDAVKVVIGFILVMGPILFVVPIILKRHKILGGAFNGVKNLASNAAKATGKLGKKAALNTKQGQAAQQFFANKKAVAGLKGKEYLRQKAEKNPMIASLMGGVGGGDISNRLFDQQNRAKRAEDIKNINGSLTGGVASAIGKRENVGSLLQSIENPANRGKKFHWSDGREVVDEDIAAMQKLRQQGFIGGDGRVKNDSMVATAAMQKIFETELAGKENIEGISSMLTGASAEENRDYSEELRRAAAAHKYKNFAGTTVSNGKVNQFFAKTGESELNPDGSARVATVTDPTTGMTSPKGYDERGNLIDVKLDGAMKVVSSGLRGVNKDALDKNHDDVLLRAIEVTHNNLVDAQGQADQQARHAFVIKTADETRDIDKKAVLDQVAKKLGVDGAVFAEIQRSLKSGGATNMPDFQVSIKTNPTPQAAPAPVVIQAPAPQAPPAPGVLNIPHGGQPAAGNAPAPVQVLPPPLPRPQPGNGPRFNNRPPRGPNGPSGPSGPGRP